MFTGVQVPWIATLPPMAQEKWGGHLDPTAIRVRAVQEMVKSPTNNAFAARLGVEPTRLANVYAGAPLGRDMAFRVAEKVPGVAPQWLWTGDYSVLSVRLADELRACEAVARAKIEAKLASKAKRAAKKARQGTARRGTTRS